MSSDLYKAFGKLWTKVKELQPARKKENKANKSFAEITLLARSFACCACNF